MRALPGWRKVRRDVWQERTRTVLVVLAIAIGIAAFGSVLSSYAILTRELNRGYLATNPASATLWTDTADADVLALVASQPGVGAVEARRTVTGRIKSGPGEWRTLRLFVVEDYGRIRISRLEPQAGAWPPREGEILIERDAMGVARARIGDTVTVKTPRGSEQTLRVSGTVHDVGQAQARMENLVYGYATLPTLARLGEGATLDQVLFVVADKSLALPAVRRVADAVKARLEAAGHPVRRVEVPEPGKHPHADIMGLLLLIKASFGLFALALSGILVVNLLAGLMGSQKRQIGILKAIGASRRQIAGIYLAESLLLGAAAVVLAVPAGVVGGRILCRAMSVFLNFDIASFAVPVWVYLLEAAVGLALPALAAIVPVWRGSAITVRQALGTFGNGERAFGSRRLDRALTEVRGPGRPALLAIRNTFRRRGRAALTVLTLAAGGVFFLTAFNLRATFVRTLDRLFESKRFDLSVGLAGMTSPEQTDRAIGNTLGILRAEGWIVTEGAIPPPGDAAADSAPAAGSPHAGGGGPHGAGALTGERFSVVALPPKSQVMELEVVEGRGLVKGDTNAMVVNSALAAKDPKLRVGQDVALRIGPSLLTWRIVGQAREPLSPAVAYISKDFIDERGGHGGMANSLRLALAKSDPASIAAVKTALDKNLEAEGVRAQSSTSKAESRYGFDQHMLMIYVFLVVVSLVLAGVGGLGLATTMSLNVLERRREMGVLRAIGAAPAAVRRLVVVEGVVLGVLAWALAAAAAFPISKALGDVLVRRLFKSGLDFAFEARAILLWLAVSVLLAALASVSAAWQASRRPVREAIGYE